MRTIRESTYADMDALLSLFDQARATIAALGIDQWQNGYPNREVLERDIERGESFVVLEDGAVVATFAMLKGEEPTYREIFEGEWLTGREGAYTAIHRFTITPSARGRGIATQILDFAAHHALRAGKRSLRIDTHEGNVVMRRMLEKNGFFYRGVIYLASGDGRVAYEKLLSPTLCHYENQPCEFLRPLVENNIGYSVLCRILARKCTHTFTNYKDIVVCHSESPYPVWVYCREVNTENMELISRLIKERFPLDTHNVILPEPLYAMLCARDAYFREAGVKMQLFAYSLDSLLPLNREVSGSAERATLDDLETLAQYRQAMSIEMEGLEFSLSECREKMRGDIERGVFYVWREGGEIVSTANLEPTEPYAKIGAVYTPPEKRRHGYAISLVHAVCALALRDGLTPILYTNGGYAASNACYIKIGFQKKSGLYNIGKS